MSLHDSPPDIPGAGHRTVTIRTRDVGELDLHVMEAGDGPPVLMLHGWPQHAWCWRKVIPLLADDYRLICPDLRGFGWSGAPGTGYDGETFGADGLALMDALDLERVHVVGHDWGGFAAFVMALQRPERVDRMVLLNTLPPWVHLSPALLPALARTWYVVALALAGEALARSQPGRLAEGIRRDVVNPDGITPADALAYTRRLAEPQCAHATRLLYRSYLRTAVEGILRPRYNHLRLTRPTRFLFGTNDAAISPALLRGMEAHADSLELELVEDSGHFIAEERPELVADRAGALFGRAQ
ncbi:MAG: alpha/beta hydrolase [Actinomycetota bacterium]